MPNTPVTWRDQQTANTTTAGFQLSPDVIQLANGNILVSWATNDPAGLGAPAGYEVFAQIFDPLGNKVGAEIRLNNASTADDEVGPHLAPLPNGGFVVVYHDLDLPANGGASNIRLEEYDANGVAASANSLVINDTSLPADPNYRRPDVAVSSATSVLVVYEEVSAGSVAIRGKIYDPTTDTYGAQISLLAFAGGNTDSEVTVLTNGNYVIACAVGGADPAIAYRIMSPAGLNVLAATIVTGTNAGGENDREPTVVALAGGGFVITWTNTDASDTDIEGRVYSAAGTQVGSFFALSDGATDNNNESKVIALADGTFIVVGDNDEVGQIGVDVQHFSATGFALGGRFQVSTDNADSIFGVGLDDGRFALVWDGSGEISLEILDTRDAPNNSGVGDPHRVIGTVSDDVFIMPANAEIAFGWDGKDTIVGGAGNDHIDGGSGNDTLLGLGGVDILIGGAGIDLTYGGMGDDQHFIDNVGDQALEAAGEGNDRVFASVSYALAAGQSIETLSTDFNGGTAAIDLSGNDLVNNVFGNDGANFLAGGGGNDILLGLGGNDILVGGTGVDESYGGSGDDQHFVDSFFDRVFETAGQGNDRVLASVNYALLAGQSIETLSTDFNAGTGAIDLSGNELANSIFGNGGVNFLAGGGGNDILLGLGGNDILAGGTGVDESYGGLGDDQHFVENPADQVFESAGQGNDRVLAGVSYVLSAGQSIETLSTDFNAGTGAIDLTGNEFANSIFGNDGANIIDGRGGSDFLLGLGGADIFVFSAALGSGNVDTLGDFLSGTDRIVLEDSTFVGLTPGANLPASAFVVGTQAQDADDRIIYNSATGALFFDADGNGAGAAVQFAFLNPGTALTANDFVVL